LPVAFEFDGDVIVLQLAGKYSTSDMKAAILSALDEAPASSGAALLFDMRESRSLEDRSADDVRDMARFLAAHGRRFGNRLAMVTNGDLAFGLMRLGAVIAESGGVVAEVFRDMPSARSWLARHPGSEGRA
jgi:hypothetical protein